MKLGLATANCLTIALCFCLMAPAYAADSLRELTVIYTNDEHGWMEGMEEDQSAAHLFDLWRRQEGYTPDGPFLVLSGGDNFTGPAISTWVQGESMVDLMNAMGYDASAVGNHEFDFGLETLKQRAREADYPYLSANTRYRESGAVPTDMGILPYSVVEVNDLRVGIIGLTTTSTPSTTNPLGVATLEFLDYEATLREAIPQVQALDIDLLFVIAHACMAALEPLAYALVEFDISLIGGGHCNELIAKQAANTVLLEGGFNFTAYAQAKFTYDLEREQLIRREFATRENRNAVADNSIQEIIQKWSDVSGTALQEVVGYNQTEVSRRDIAQHFIDTWLYSDSTADVAISNGGGIRTPLTGGEITLDAVVTMTPFDNTIFAINVTGAVIAEALTIGRVPLVAGMQEIGGEWILDRSGEPLQADRIYRVLLNSFMYAGGDNYQRFAEADPDGFDTSINYRQPFLDFIRKQQSTSVSPIVW